MEVMVAVMIVSVVIAALIQMRGDSSTKLFNIKKMIHTNQYNSFLLSQENKYGFEKSNIDMERLVEDFDLESNLRRKLKSIKVKLDYEELKIIDTNEYDDSEQDVGSGVIFEIGKTVLKSDEISSSLIRIIQQ